MRRRRAPKRRPPLPTDGRPWHVDWFGCVRRAASRGETQVELLLSPIRRGWWSTGGYCHSASERSFIEPGQQRVVPVSLDLFVRTPIGSVLLDGEHEAPIRYEDYEVGVSTERLRFIETAVALAGTRYPVGGHGRGWCLELRIEADDTRVVVPVLEVLRFYYGTSSALLNALLSCDFDRAFSLVRDPARSRPDCGDGRCTVCLRPAMAKKDAQVVAALVSSEVARRCARRIFPSLVFSYRRFGNAYPKVYPPFEGPTAARLGGLWLGSPGQRLFLALEIQHSELPASVQEIALLREARPSRVLGANENPGPPDFEYREDRSRQRRRFSNECRLLEPKGSPQWPRPSRPSDWYWLLKR